MTTPNLARREFLRTLALSGVSCMAAGACGAEPSPVEGTKEGGLHEPVHRVAKATNPPAAEEEKHPLDPALDMARQALVQIGAIKDYTCRITKQERIRGELGQIEQMDAKIRNRKMENGKLLEPLSVYLGFVAPDNVKGREVIWVEGKNNGKLKAHEGGIKGRFLPSVWLDPEGPLAMNGQLHPIYDIGIENLVLKLIERGTKEKKFGECQVNFRPGATIKLGKTQMVCTVLEVMHPVKRPHFEFHLAQIFIDDALKIPVRYAAYYWPETEGAKELPVLEQYTYTNLKLNVGLTDADFDPNNPNYNF
jgi:hypothetical protein